MPKVMSIQKAVAVTSSDIYLGVDPGQSGGLGIIISGTTQKLANGIPMPSTETDTWYAIQEHSIAKRAVIELVHSMPGQGVSSTFKFGKNYGMLRGFLIAVGIPFEEVSPRKWQAALGIIPRNTTKVKRQVRKKNGKVVTKLVDKESRDQFKNRLKALAQQWFPGVPITLKTADALLLAEYIRRKDQGLLEKK